MSINFATLKGLAIPEGNVTQIADASGRVLWSAVKKAVITIEGGNNYTYVDIDGVTYDTAATIEVPIGTVINCVTYNSNYGGCIEINYDAVASATTAGSVQYEYTVVGDTTITFITDDPSGYGYTPRGKISIIDINKPDLPLVVITHSASNGSGNRASVTIDGKTYTTGTRIFAPVGTVITCTALYTQSPYKVGGTISVNGVAVVKRPEDVTSSGQTTYQYIVIGNTSIQLYSSAMYVNGSQMVAYSEVRITEN